MKIAIYHQNELVCRRLTILCRNYHPEILSIDIFLDAEELLAKKPLYQYDLIMLQLNQDGLRIKQQLWKQKCDNRLLFIGRDPEWLPDAFGKHVFGCIDLPVQRRQLYGLLDMVMHDYMDLARISLTDIHDVYRVIYMKDITNIYVEGNYTIVKLLDETRYLMRRSLKEWMDCLDFRFIRVHRSYVVNMDYIVGIKENIMLTTGECIPVARVNIKNIQQLLEAYHGIA